MAMIKGSRTKFSTSFPRALVAGSALTLAGFVAGCTGTTYGTGVSSEMQLAQDVGGIVSLGTGGREKTVIDYNARPKLVKAPAAGSLPAPAETVENQSAYFPTNPEEARAKRLRENANDPTLRDDGDLGYSSTGEPVSRGPIVDRVKRLNQDPSPAEMRAQSINGREERAKRVAEINGVGTGTQPRRYLTEPPVEYRTPAETAEAGSVGEKEVDRQKKKSETFFDNPFKGIWGG